MTSALAKAIAENSAPRATSDETRADDCRYNAGIIIDRPLPTQRQKPRGNKASIRGAHPHLKGLAIRGSDWTRRRKAKWQGSRDDAKRIVRQGETVKTRKASKAKRQVTDGGWRLVLKTTDGQHGDARYLYRKPDGKMIRGDFERDSHGKRV